MSILNDVSAQVDEVSIDEAFLDVSGLGERLITPGRCGCDPFSNAVLVAPAVFRWGGHGDDGRQDRLDNGKTGRSAGCSCRRYSPVPAFVARRSALGSGDKTVKSLAAIGVYSVADLAALPPQRLSHAVGRASAARLMALASGQEVRPVAGRVAEKSIGSEHTFDVDVTSLAELEKSIRLEVEGDHAPGQKCCLTAAP